MKNGIQSLVLVTVLLLLFLDWRLALLVAFGIPFSFAGTFIVLYIGGFTINMLSLFGMIMALGMVVDDAIVTGENVFRLYSQGESAVEAAVRGAIAQAGAANTQTGFYTLAAPYDGVVAEVPASVGDMAMPGKPMVTVYEPGEMRVVASLPQSRVTELPADASVRVEIPALAKEARWQSSTTVTVLPTADAGSQSVRVRLGLPTGLPVVPGMFARAAFPLKGSGDARLLVPARAVIRRTELTAVYVVPPKGGAQLRQVRLGKTQGDEIEVLSGVHGGERIAIDPVAAAR